jgi:hypothetical protein
MPANAWSVSILGLDINPEKFVRMERRRCCDHPVSAANNCSVCGSQIWQDVQVLIEECDADEMKVEKVKTVCGYPVYRHSNNLRTFVGLVVRTKGCQQDEDRAPVRLELPADLPRYKAEMKKKLEPLGLWDEKRWGLWSLLETMY